MKESPSFGLKIPGLILIVCMPAVGHRQANRTVLGIPMAELD